MTEPTNNVISVDSKRNEPRIEKSHLLFQMIEKRADLSWHQLWRYNEFTHEVEYATQPPWRSKAWHEDDAHMFAKALLDEGKSVNKQAILDAVEMSAHQHKYHPIRDYLSSLTWDGIERIDTFFPSTLGCDNNVYTRALGRKTVIGAVLRVMEPGCMHRIVPILEGGQNTGKSTWVKILAGEKHYACAKLTSKTMLQPQWLAGKWIIEFAELSGLNEVRMDSVKAFVSQASDHYRAPYGRNYHSYARESIFIGTYNPSNRGYLTDPTGSTRFWPVTTGRIEIPALQKYRDQYFAEALTYVRNGETSEITDPEVIRISEIEQAKRDQPSHWFKWLSEYMAFKTFADIDDLLRYLGIDKSRFTSKHMTDIQDDMRRLGYSYEQKSGKFTTLNKAAKAEETIAELW